MGRGATGQASWSSLRAIARELGIHRNTAQKYAQAESLPVRLINITPQAPSPDAEGAA